MMMLFQYDWEGELEVNLKLQSTPVESALKHELDLIPIYFQ